MIKSSLKNIILGFQLGRNNRPDFFLLPKTTTKTEQIYKQYIKQIHKTTVCKTPHTQKQRTVITETRK